MRVLDAGQEAGDREDRESEDEKEREHHPPENVAAKALFVWF